MSYSKQGLLREIIEDRVGRACYYMNPLPERDFKKAHGSAVRVTKEIFEILNNWGYVLDDNDT